MWGLNGATGALVGIAGKQNDAIRKPLAAYVKDVLRGREKWGMKHRLAKLWAQNRKLELSAAEAMPRRSVKRARSAPPAGDVPKMGDMA